MHIFLRITLVAILCLAQLQGRAADLRQVDIERVGDRYLLQSSTWFAVDRESLFQVIIDYDHFVDMSSVFVEGRNIAPNVDGKPRFYTLMEGCVFVFCKRLKRYGWLEIHAPDEVVARIDPGTSDFRFSKERWRLKEENGGTLMTYEFEMEPGFWVPPIIGPYMIRHTLIEGGTEAVDRIEALAQKRAAEK